MFLNAKALYQEEKLWTRVMLVAACGLFVAISLIVDAAIFDRTFLQEGYPDWGRGGLIRLTISLIAAVALAYAVIPEGAVTGSFSPMAGRAREIAFAVVLLLTYGVHLWASVALVAAPEHLYMGVDELGAISVLQEGAVALAFLLLLTTALFGNGLRNASVVGVPARLIGLGLSVAVLALLLEETSYGQHYFGWTTPDLFEGNIQNETNLHNFYTHRFEMVYYGAAFLGFILLPLFMTSVPRWVSREIEPFVPPAGFAFFALPLVAGMYLSWNITPQQVMFFAGLAIGLLVIARRIIDRQLHVLLLAAALALITGCQMIYLIFGSRLVAGYEVAEIREASICFALLAYALWIFDRHYLRSGLPLGK